MQEQYSLLPHLGHSYSQITTYMPVKRKTFYKKEKLRVWVKSLNIWRRSRELSRYAQHPHSTEYGWFCVWSACLPVCAPPFYNIQTDNFIYLAFI